MFRLSSPGGRLAAIRRLAMPSVRTICYGLSVCVFASNVLAAAVPTFTPALSVSGLNDPYGALGIYGPGVAVFDFDDDGDLDLFIPNDLSGHKLYINVGLGGFIERASDYGLDFTTELPPVQDRTNPFEQDPTAMMPNFIDTDNDGDLDFFLTCWNAYCRFFENVGGSYVDRTMASGLATVGHSTTAAWADYNRDGLLDVYIADWGGFDHLFKNNGDNTWEDVSDRVGLYDVNTDPMPGWSALWWDHNGDGWLDLYVGNDYGLPNFFYVGDGSGRFEERAREFFPEMNNPQNPAAFGATMGQALGDYDRDGDYDLFVANSQINDFFRRDGNLFYDMLEMPEMIGPGGLLTNFKNNDIGWFCDFPDLNNDGWVDLFLVNGYIRMCLYDDPENPDCFGEGQPEQPNLLWVNRGDGGFDRVTDQAGLTDLRWGKSGAFADYDRDGDLDLIVTNSAGMNNPGSHGFWTNETDAPGHWMVLTLEGTDSNRDAIGAEVSVRAGGVTHRRGRFHSTGYLAQSSHELHFGLGAATSIEWMEVTWPRTGTVERFEGLQVDRRYHVTEGSGLKVPALVAPQMVALATDEGIELRWHVDPDLEFDRFMISRSEQGSVGGTIATIDADWSTTDYRWLDDSARPGHRYRYTLTAERQGVRVDGAATVIQAGAPSNRVAVGPAVPNPFNPRTELRYRLPIGAKGSRLRILDVRGRVLRAFEGIESGAWETITWDGLDSRGAAVASGSYRFVVEANGQVESTPLTLVR